MTFSPKPLEMLRRTSGAHDGEAVKATRAAARRTVGPGLNASLTNDTCLPRCGYSRFMMKSMVTSR